MYCTKCGYELKDGTNFCRKCGSQNIYNTIIPNEKKSTFDINNSSNELNTKDTNLKEPNAKQNKPKGFIFLGIFILLLSVGFGSYYFSVSKFFADSKKSQEASTKNKVTPKGTTTKKASNVKPKIAEPVATTDVSTPENYIFSKSGSEKLIDSDVSELSKENLILAKNEIYARHGFVFKSEQFKSYFSKKSWYKPNDTFKGSDGELNDVERYNIQLILKYENK